MSATIAWFYFIQIPFKSILFFGEITIEPLIDDDGESAPLLAGMDHGWIQEMSMPTLT